MKYSREGILKYAKMAKLVPADVSYENADGYLDFFKEKDFNDVISMINNVLKVDVSLVSEELEYFKDYKLPLREDKCKMSNNKDELLQNAKTTKYGYFVVPKVIE